MSNPELDLYRTEYERVRDAFAGFDARAAKLQEILAEAIATLDAEGEPEDDRP